MSLAALQEALHQHILHGSTAIEAALAQQGGLSPSERLRIYHDAYRWRLIEVMQDHFAQTHAYLGDELFNGEALSYIEAHHSQHHSLRDYGQTWPDWLALRHPQDTDMADLAQLEWALRHAFDDRDASTLTMQDLALVPTDAWATLGFSMAPGTTMLNLNHAVAPLWQSLSQGQAPEPVQAQSTCMAVWRQGWQPHFRTLPLDEAQALRVLMAGGAFTQACEHLGDSEAAANHAGQWLQQWVAEGLLSGLVMGAFPN